MRPVLFLVCLFLPCLCWKSLNEQLDRVVNSVVGSQGGVGSGDIDNLWTKYKHLQGGAFDDEIDRKQKFEFNVRQMIDHNRQYKAGAYTYKLGINKYSHLSHEEFKHIMNGFRRPVSKRKNPKRAPLKRPWSSVSNNEESVDWRDKGIVTPVKDQGLCGSCYAFSAVGALEGMYALAGHNLTELSEQQLVDCSYGWGNYGCDGGFMEQCFDYVRDAGGIEGESDYPYEGTAMECKFASRLTVTSCDMFIEIPENDDSALLDAVRTVGPIAVGIDAGSPKFMSYSEGVYNDSTCSAEELNHAVLLVGYGAQVLDNVSHQYWLVKNSWGTSWGEEGYIKMSRLQENICGISADSSYPVLNKTKMEKIRRR